MNTFITRTTDISLLGTHISNCFQKVSEMCISLILCYMLVLFLIQCPIPSSCEFNNLPVTKHGRKKTERFNFFYFLCRVFGIRWGTIIFSSIVTGGQCVYALGAFVNQFWLMQLGRFIFG